MKTPFLTQPYLLSLNPAHEMSVVWLQQERGECRVEYGSEDGFHQIVNCSEYRISGLRAPADPDRGYAPTPEENPPLIVWQYIAVIPDLKSGQHIRYRCLSDGYSSPVYDFFAAPDKEEPFRFALMSDLQGIPPCEETVRRIGREKCDFLLYSGDLNWLSWRADKWFDMDMPYQTADERLRSFFPCMQQAGIRMMQYCPTFLCPGNHEVDDLRVGMDREFAKDDSHWSCSIYMQLFRPLYPKQEYGLEGERWYTARWGDLQIFSLSVVRWAQWDAYEAPGWKMLNDISPDSPQIRWLRSELSRSDAKFKWVIHHWHLLNKGSDVQPALCPPVMDENGQIAYPADYGTGVLMPLYEQYGVNGVSYGHSHVYERYCVNGVHYIEAAYMAVCYREPNAALHPAGFRPIVENNDFRSYAIVDRRMNGLFATGHRAEGEPYIFDEYQLADADGKPVI